jgi:hypothetical protein
MIAFIKKIFIFVLLLCAVVGITPVQSEATILSQQTIYGATHIKEQRSFGTATSVVNYLGADFTQGAFKIITGDDYTKTSFRPAPVLKHAENTQATFDEYVVIGGVNADFFEGFGVPQEAYIKDGQVISSGIGYAARSVIGFKADGSVVAGKPVFDGFELIVKDSQGKERIKMPLKNINGTYYANPYDAYAYFDTYTQPLATGVNKFVLDVIETKGAMPKIYGRGRVIDINNQEQLNVQSGQIVIMSQNVYLENLIEQDDIITVQRRMVGDFEGVMWGIGAYGHLVEDGIRLESIVGIDPTFRHPRSAIGVKADGSVFFVTVDGRQPGVSAGATLYELADLMIEYGAVLAYNFDGGGSTTMVLRDETDAFYVANQPSDSPPRSVTNSMFLALQVRFDDLTPHPIPDYSVPLLAPQNVMLSLGKLTWQAVSYRESYVITVNENEYSTLTTSFDLSEVIDTPGHYEVSVMAKGDGIFFSDSVASETIIFDYQGPVELRPPGAFVLFNGILYWDQNDPHNRYRVTLEDRVYTISLNRFNLSTQNLAPGLYPITVQALGDGFNTADSEITTYYYRIYSQTEQEVQETLKLFLEILYQRSKK